MSGVHVPVGHPPVVICTPGNRELCEGIVGHLSWSLGKVRFRTFANGEISVKLEQSVANHDVFVVCSRDDSENEVNFMLIQLLVLLDALKAEAPYRVTLILPCIEYSRQDRKFEAGEALAPKLLLHLLVTAGADRFVTLDLHNPAECGFSPAQAALDELSCELYLASAIRELIPGFNEQETFVCAMDAGAVKRTRRMADELQAGFMMAVCERFCPEEAGRVRIISDASHKPKNVIVIDDMFDTCATLARVVESVRSHAPDARIFAIATHGYFSKDAADHVSTMVKSHGLEWLAVTNCISTKLPLQKFAELGIAERLKIVDVSRLLAGAVIRVHLGTSVNVPKFRQLGPKSPDPLLAEAALVPTTQYTLRGAATVPGR